MHEEDPTHDLKVAETAGRQHGRIAYWQLTDLGLGRGAIAHRAETGRLHAVRRGIYAVGYVSETAEALEMEAVLACGAGAVVSHWTAAARWKLLRPVRGRVHVSLSSDRRVPGIRTHLVKALHPHDKTKRDGIPITSVPRTLLDIAGVADERTVRRAVNQAARSGWLNRNAIDEMLQRNPRRQGSKQLRTLIASVHPGTRRTRSDLEVAFLLLLEKYRLPQPVINAVVMGFEVDFHWPGTNLIVELDGFEYHRTPIERENDRLRDAKLKRAGYEVLRVTDAWLDTDPAGVAEAVKSLLACPG
jgi:very-short-patch-repair endonuclease